jgi:hydroxyacylglutathione hydrolase
MYINAILYSTKVHGSSNIRPNMIFRQLFEKESSTYTYLLADEQTKEALLIDPVIETIDRDLKLLKELGLHLKYVLETHIHADHISSSFELRKRTKAKIAVSKHSGANAIDIYLKDGDTLSLGKLSIKVLETPGHTDGCLSYVLENKIFTGDALLIRGCGRTDFQNGSSEKLYNSIQKLFSLPSETIVYPGHDYNGFLSSTIAEEKKYNPRIAEKSLKEFVEIMANLKLSLPKKINEAVPANLGEKL